MVATARKMIGATNPLASEPGTIRGDFAIEVGRNVIHGSDSPENGERETGRSGLGVTAAYTAWDLCGRSHFARSGLLWDYGPVQLCAAMF